MLKRGCLTAFIAMIGAIGGSFGWFVWRVSDYSLPPLAQGMSSEFASGKQVFGARIENGYPIGSSEAKLVSNLKSQGFEITAYPNGRSKAELSRFIGCGSKVWSVYWSADDGKVTEITSMYGAVCI